jgi:hypothetical protein
VTVTGATEPSLASPPGVRERFAHAVALALTTWGDLAEWQQLAIMAISPELGSRLAAADEITDELGDEITDELADKIAKGSDPVIEP